ncbi:MAG TPA: hypothetical protein VE441_03615 [Mycobacterium sp.]|nr:hypothetical protein [Mycobacterium sp.]
MTARPTMTERVARDAPDDGCSAVNEVKGAFGREQAAVADGLPTGIGPVGTALSYRIRRDGQSEPAPLVLSLPDDDYAACCTSMYEQRCLNSNLFDGTAAATAWASAHSVSGEVLTLPLAAERGAARWAPLAKISAL